MELNPTSYVVLGMLRHEPRSGYQIKRIVDNSTRFFWAASYGQIYPELRRLAKAGLVEGEAQATGARKRTVYRLTGAGRKEKRRLHEQKIARLREVEPKAAAAAASGDPFPYLVLRYGIESSESTIAWCD